MHGEIVNSDLQTEKTSLGDRLDETIGETSTGIGTLLSELIHRSLKMGVSDIGESLVDFAEEQVENAVNQRLPEITEAADAVARSTSQTIVKQAVGELNEKSAEQQRFLESRIDAAEISAVDRSRTHVEDVLVGVHQSIDQARTIAVEGNDLSQQRIAELREKARNTWQKLRGEFSTVNDAHQQLRQEHESLSKQFAEFIDHQSRQAVAAEEKFSELLVENQRLRERVAALEQPRGIKGLIAKLRGGAKSASEFQPEINDDDDAPETDTTDD